MNRSKIFYTFLGRAQGGFTLIELMVVVVIVSIIASIAIPSYRDHVVRATRSSAESYMMQVANKEDEIMLDSRSYIQISPANNATFGNAPSAATPGVGVPVPDQLLKKYQFSITVPAAAAGSPASFTITAVPDPAYFIDPACQTLTLQSDGTKGVSGGATATAQTCWK